MNRKVEIAVGIVIALQPVLWLLFAFLASKGYFDATGP